MSMGGLAALPAGYFKYAQVRRPSPGIAPAVQCRSNILSLAVAIGSMLSMGWWALISALIRTSSLHRRARR